LSSLKELERSLGKHRARQQIIVPRRHVRVFINLIYADNPARSRVGKNLFGIDKHRCGRSCD